MKGCIKVLKDQPPNSVEGLLNALRCVYVPKYDRKMLSVWIAPKTSVSNVQVGDFAY